MSKCTDNEMAQMNCVQLSSKDIVGERLNQYLQQFKSQSQTQQASFVHPQVQPLWSSERSYEHKIDESIDDR
jgi:hypothetical protein